MRAFTPHRTHNVYDCACKMIVIKSNFGFSCKIRPANICIISVYTQSKTHSLCGPHKINSRILWQAQKRRLSITTASKEAKKKRPFIQWYYVLKIYSLSSFRFTFHLVWLYRARTHRAPRQPHKTLAKPTHFRCVNEFLFNIISFGVFFLCVLLNFVCRSFALEKKDVK